MRGAVQSGISGIFSGIIMFCFVQFDFRYEAKGCRYDEIQRGLKEILVRSYWCVKAVGMYSFYNSQLITIIRAQHFDGLCYFMIILCLVTRVWLLDHTYENQGLQARTQGGVHRVHVHPPT